MNLRHVRMPIRLSPSHERWVYVIGSLLLLTGLANLGVWRDRGPAHIERPPLLNLALPRGASAPWRERNPALDDPRSSTRRPTGVENLTARVLGGDPNGPISEEPMADGSVRLRRGRACVIVRPNRSQAIDPYNSSYSPKPRVVDSC